MGTASWFGVRLEGTDCWLPVQMGGLFRRTMATDLCGFYTTRFVEAGSPQEAAEKAEALVAAELRALVVNGDRPFGITVESVWSHTGPLPTQGRGFTWFNLDEPQMPQNRLG